MTFMNTKFFKLGNEKQELYNYKMTSFTPL